MQSNVTGQLMLSFESDDLVMDYAIGSANEIIRDRDCTIDTPIVHGYKPEVIYGRGIEITPAVPGRMDTPHMKKQYLSNLDPLESYDRFYVLFSGGEGFSCFSAKFARAWCSKRQNNIITP